MYSITEQTKQALIETLHEASMIIASIPESMQNDLVKKSINETLHNSTNQMNLLNNLKPIQVADMREFHQMD